MLYRVLVGLLLGASVACAALWFTASKRGAELEVAHTLTRELKTSLTAAAALRDADTASGNARTVLSVSSKKRKESDAQVLHGAVKNAPDWASQEVPADVAAALRL